MLSGGEPTLHPRPRADHRRAAGAARAARRASTRTASRSSRDDALLAFLADRRSRLEVYLQWDGPDPAATRALRGADLAGVRVRALGAADRRAGVHDARLPGRGGRQRRDGGRRAAHWRSTRRTSGASCSSRCSALRAVDPRRARDHDRGDPATRAQAPEHVDADDFVALPVQPPRLHGAHLLRPRRPRRVAVAAGPRGPGADAGAPRPGQQPPRAGRRDVGRPCPALLSGSMSASRGDMVEHLVGLATACRLDVERVRPHAWAGRVLGRTRRRRGSRPARQADQRQGLHGRLDAQRGAAPPVLRPRGHGRAGRRPGPVRIPFCARNTLPGLYARANRGMVTGARGHGRGRSRLSGRRPAVTDGLARSDWDSLDAARPRRRARANENRAA